tara:strand:- start:1444 stop:1860 length:417 start_codon:yes stop_codon:yes gene_type:complete
VAALSVLATTIGKTDDEFSDINRAFTQVVTEQRHVGKEYGVKLRGQGEEIKLYLSQVLSGLQKAYQSLIEQLSTALTNMANSAIAAMEARSKRVRTVLDLQTKTATHLEGRILYGLDTLSKWVLDVESRLEVKESPYN